MVACCQRSTVGSLLLLTVRLMPQNVQVATIEMRSSLRSCMHRRRVRQPYAGHTSASRTDRNSAAGPGSLCPLSRIVLCYRMTTLQQLMTRVELW